VGLFACLGGIRTFEVFTGPLPVSEGGAAGIDRSTSINTASGGEECECCAGRCSVMVDRARATFDVADLLPLWTVLAVGAAVVLASASSRRPPTAHDRSRWWCRPTPASLCVILR